MKITHTHCCYCRRRFSLTEALLKKTKDHFMPRCRTGINGANILQCCLECNRWKADSTPAQWLEKVIFQSEKRPQGSYNKRDYAQIIGSLKHWIRYFKGAIISEYKNF